MKATNKLHWQNGHQVRGGWFHTLNVSILSYGLMITWAWKNRGINNPYSLQVFKLN